ncbi:MAG: hypothetical protein SPH32_02995 [Erysipelotrichaceae bacterium]|nr:hypothetical protein [Erysipelotrichaceae bacterium]
MKKLLALCLSALVLVGCASNTETTTTETSAPATTETTEETTAPETTEAAVATTGKYVVTNTTGETVTELYIYQTDATEKGENYAGEGLADGASVTIEVEVAEDVAEGYEQTVEYVTESGRTENGFKTLHLEEANLNLLAADADTYTSATPFSLSN